MGAYLLHEGATVRCKHQGYAKPLASNPRVRVGGKNTVVLTNFYSITLCKHEVSGNPVPCVTGSWTAGSRRVRSLGQPLVLTDSESTSVPNGTPLDPESFQQRVSAQE